MQCLSQAAGSRRKEEVEIETGPLDDVWCLPESAARWLASKMKTAPTAALEEHEIKRLWRGNENFLTEGRITDDFQPKR